MVGLRSWFVYEKGYRCSKVSHRYITSNKIQNYASFQNCLQTLVSDKQNIWKLESMEQRKSLSFA